MTREQAIAKLRKLYGAKLYWRVGPTVTSPEKREAARHERQAARERIADITAEINQRLAQLEWYQALLAEKRELRKIEDAATSEMLHYKFSVGHQGEVFTHTTGQGDTWEEAIAQAEAKHVKTA